MFAFFAVFKVLTRYSRRGFSLFFYISMLTSTYSNCKCSKTKLCTSECRQFIYDDTRSWTSSTGRKKPYRMIELSQKGKKKKKKKLIKFS